MLGRVLLILGSVHVASKILGQKFRQQRVTNNEDRSDSTRLSTKIKKNNCEDDLLLIKSCEEKKSSLPDDLLVKSSEDKISALPDDLLVKILLFLPIEDVVATMILLKRWEFIWSMVPQLRYMDSDYKQRRGKSICQFLDESLKRHKAPILQSLTIQLDPRCPVGADEIRKWIEIVVDRKVRKLELTLKWWLKPPTTSVLPESLYISDTLVSLSISNKVSVDVNFTVCLPSLKSLYLVSVVYKEDDSLVRLLAGCPILQILYVVRHDRDNLTNFIVKVPSLENFVYDYRQLEPHNFRNMAGSLVIDSASLKSIAFVDYSGNTCSFEKKSRLGMAQISVYNYLDDKFVRFLSSFTSLNLFVESAEDPCEWYTTTKFSQLIKCGIQLWGEIKWFKPFMCFLQNSPKLEVLRIKIDLHPAYLPPSFDRPSSVPECLSNHLEIFEWKNYGGRQGDKELMRYILANSKRLKKAVIYLPAEMYLRDPKRQGKVKIFYNRQERERLVKELESMPRVSTSSQLHFRSHKKK